ncbi:UDP-N-acetylmuramate dehydrogenase [Antarcticibacterium sp. 1MA-6-2]|uniref:UDP-N-acetylmuramate dehydrogenase n=1 Tax=Antarcticibacterium sp. 1MA-6-2 TaxID=2908210 RepID=UPI001F19E389|nr:UDP-N-acetylmuramate dehydrogenase [Antarcticibacterium sp. 1MA-6-2]UJH91112.1 UDP-N-acetylmuramate dehydrogenase [Antarcticibacterium sp. 1MA-6-2]
MKISRNTSLKPYNTFGIDVTASRFISVTTLEDLKEVLRKNYSEDLFILGGGSNMLLTKDVEATVLHVNLKGKEIITETEDEVLVKFYAGESWHETVLFALENDWGGLENLSLIPGNTGTAPIQNIGAYGVELKDSFVSCEAIDIQTLELITFTKEACKFGYRDSIFKSEVKDKYIITSVTFGLTKRNHVLNTGYGAIEEALTNMGINSPSIKDVSSAVIKIRKQKLPDPKVLGNSGSFFKNPIVSTEELKQIQARYPEIPFYIISEDEVKIPAGWLIDKAGLKGYREGDAGVHQHQALVLVNYGSARGRDILHLAETIQSKIRNQFNIELHPEVNIF